MILFLISLFIIIVVHEAAHLIVAKKCKCGVIRYSIGFGKPILFSKKIGNTTYQITPWLFGGFCELKGELKTTIEKDAFINLIYRKKLAISIAGCAVNMIMGLVTLIIGKILLIYPLIVFGTISLFLGASNWFLPIPCLDGGYALWYPILTKIFGYKRGAEIFAKAVRISFAIVMALNIACIPLLIQIIRQGVL